MNNVLLFLILLLFAVLPSFIWVFYYFKKDTHPEPKKLLLLVFFAGAVVAIIGYFFQKGAVGMLSDVARNFPEYISFFVFFQAFFITAFSEETFKYLAFFFTVRHHCELDEPVDIIIYMITAALGFAALENFLVLSSLATNSLNEIAIVSGLRFLSATFLHAIASGILGAFLVFSYRHSNKLLILAGVVIATVIHATYNFLIMRAYMFPVEINVFSSIHSINSLPFITIYPVVFLVLFLLVSLSAILSLVIEQIKKMDTVCVLKK